MNFSLPWVRDVAERAGWTAVEGALGIVVASVAGLPTWWAVAIGAAAAAAKGWVAKHIAPDAGSSPAALPLFGRRR